MIIAKHDNNPIVALITKLLQDEFKHTLSEIDKEEIYIKCFLELLPTVYTRMALEHQERRENLLEHHKSSQV